MMIAGVDLAYPLRWLTDEQAQQVIDLSEHLHAKFAATVSEIALGRPEFCTFEDMFQFNRVAWVGDASCAA